MDTFDENTNVDVDLKTSWNLAVVDMYIGGVKWPRVRGPITAMIAALDMAGWKPSRPNYWVREEKRNGTYPERESQ